MEPMNNTYIFSKTELENYANIMIWGLKKARRQQFNTHDFIEIKYENEGLPLAEKIYIKLIQQGVIPILKAVKTPDMEKAFFKNADNEQITQIEPGSDNYYSKIAGTISIIAPSSLDHLKKTDPEKISIFSKSRQKIRAILNEREKQGNYSWSLCMFPTAALAHAAKCSIEEYADQISKACFLKEKNPVNQWESLSKKCNEIKQKLEELDIEYFRIISANMDLYIKNGEKRKWLGISGRNIPSFEIFISPDWRETSGTYFANQPSYKNGQIIKNIRLKFEHGEIISANADQGEKYLKKIIDTDPGAKRIGEFSMTDKKFSKINAFMANTLYDENYGGQWGNTHIALGNSYSNSFSQNMDKLDAKLKEQLGFNQSAIHWDIVNTEEKTVTAILKNGQEKMIYKNGEFTI